MVKNTKFPPGWDEERVRRVIAYYEQQTKEEAVAAFEEKEQTFIEIPNKLVSKVRELIARYQSTTAGK